MMPRTLLTILVCTLTLAGCTLTGPAPDLHNAAAPDLSQLLAEQKQAAGSVRLSLLTDQDRYAAGETFAARIRLSNPEGRTIDSVRSWIAFDPAKLEVVKLDDSTSDFDLTLSQENSFDRTKGLISIGRSSQQPVALKEAAVETIVFRVLPTTGEKNTSLDFYGYEAGTHGYTGAYEITDSTLTNILQPPPVPGVKLILLPRQS